ncbi:MAG: autorepressor SdpR family transcription factor [Pseudomonadota bacterium]
MNDIYKALAHPVRRQILAALRERAHSAGEIADLFSIAKPTLSGHLNVMKNADLVSVERRGQTLIYRVNISVLEDALANLMDMFKIGAEEEETPVARVKAIK